MTPIQTVWASSVRLAVAVALSHSYPLAGIGPAYSPLNAQGAIAVLGFFVLSGFVMAEALSNYYKGRYTAFLANRALRLGPPLCLRRDAVDRGSLPALPDGLAG